MKRKPKGFHIVELCASLIVLVPIVLYAIDMATIFFAGSINSHLCRDACRAAAAGPPTDYCSDLALSPAKRAELVIKAHYDPKAIIRVSQTPLITENIQEPKPMPPWGGPVRGQVTVQTEVTVNPPFNLPAVAQSVQMKTESSFPITWVMQPNYKGAVPGTSKPAGTAPSTGGGGEDGSGGTTDAGDADPGSGMRRFDGGGTTDPGLRY